VNKDVRIRDNFSKPKVVRDQNVLGKTDLEHRNITVIRFVFERYALLTQAGAPTVGI
jgi:hypothetical protein